MRRMWSTRAGRALAMVAGALALLPLAACGSNAPGKGSSVGSVPAPGPQRFYAQRLDWTSCAPFECAYLEVPLDYGHPDGRTARIAVMRSKASRPDQRIGSLVVNPGGPGASGTDAVSSLAKRVRNTPLGERFDLVGFDPRGVGASQPAIKCYTPRELDAHRLEVELDTSPGSVAHLEQERKDYVAKCVQRSGLDLLANVGTRDVARDMDVLRSALGDEKLTYLGYSYGTRLGYTYAEQFPRNVRALVLDGALDPDQTVPDEEVAQIAGFQQAFNTFSAWCAQQRGCPLGNDPKATTRNYRKLVERTINDPIPLADGRKLSYNDALLGTNTALYSPANWPQLFTGLTELADGHGETLMGLADLMEGRQSDGSYDRIQDVLTAVRCVDDNPITDPSVALRVSGRAIQAAPYADDGHGPSPALGACAFWPVPPTSVAHQPRVTGLPRTLVVSTTGDPATPYLAGVKLAKALDAELLTVHGTQHTAALHGDGCVDSQVTAYLVNLQPPRGVSECTITPSS